MTMTTGSEPQVSSVTVIVEIVTSWPVQLHSTVHVHSTPLCTYTLPCTSTVHVHLHPTVHLHSPLHGPLHSVHARATVHRLLCTDHYCARATVHRSPLCRLRATVHRPRCTPQLSAWATLYTSTVRTIPILGFDIFHSALSKKGPEEKVETGNRTLELQRQHKYAASTIST